MAQISAVVGASDVYEISGIKNSPSVGEKIEGDFREIIFQKVQFCSNPIFTSGLC